MPYSKKIETEPVGGRNTKQIIYSIDKGKHYALYDVNNPLSYLVEQRYPCNANFLGLPSIQFSMGDLAA